MINTQTKDTPYTVALAITNNQNAATSSWGGFLFAAMEVKSIKLGTREAQFGMSHGGTVEFAYEDLVDSLHANIMGNTVILTYTPVVTFQNIQPARDGNMYAGMQANQLDRKQRIEAQVTALAFSTITLPLVSALRKVARGVPVTAADEPETESTSERVTFDKRLSFSTGHHPTNYIHVQSYTLLPDEKIEITYSKQFERGVVTEVLDLSILARFLRDGMVLPGPQPCYEEEHRALLQLLLNVPNNAPIESWTMFTTPLEITFNLTTTHMVGYCRLPESNDTGIATLRDIGGLKDMTLYTVVNLGSFKNYLENGAVKHDEEHHEFLFNVVGYKEPEPWTRLATPIVLENPLYLIRKTIIGYRHADEGLVLRFVEGVGLNKEQLVSSPDDFREKVGRDFELVSMAMDEESMVIYRAMFGRDPIAPHRQFEYKSTERFVTSVTVSIDGARYKLRGYTRYAEGIAFEAVGQCGIPFVRNDGSHTVLFESATATVMKTQPERVEALCTLLNELVKPTTETK